MNTNTLKSAKPFSENQAIEEASRCLLCFDAPCSKNCPAKTDPASFIRSIRFKNYKGAAETIKSANLFAETCSLVCPYDELCEKDCTRKNMDKPVKIGKLQNFALNKGSLNYQDMIKNIEKKNKKVAVIGSGPAGLTATGELAKSGYDVTVFEKEKFIGGLLKSGIIPYRLPKDAVERDIELIKELGVTFKTDCELGRNLSKEDLDKEGYEAVLIAVGNSISKHSELFDPKTEGVICALDFLKLAEEDSAKLVKDKKIVIIGGGDVAIDSALSSYHNGALRTTILYRRRVSDMPASAESLDMIHKDKLDIFTCFTPIEYISDKSKITAVKAKGTYDTSEIILDADLVIEAIGQMPQDLNKIFPELKIQDNMIIADNSKTNIPGIFAAGDITNKGKTVVEAVKEGKDAAKSIDEYLNKKPAEIFNIIKNNDEILRSEFCGISTQNPFFLSSSPVGHSFEMCSKAFDAGWSGIVYKTITKFTCDECSPRFHSIGKETTPFIGFKNMEQLSEKSFEEDLDTISKLKKRYPHKIIVSSIMGQNDDEWTELAKLSQQAGADMIECNFSCPQVAKHGLGSDVGQNPELVMQYSKAVRKGTTLAVLAKMTPNIGHMEIPALSAINGGATGISAINTIKSITAIDIDKFTCYPVVNGKSSISGYSGKAVKPIALRFIAQIKQDPILKNIPVSAMGGIETWQDGLEFLLLGAGNLQVTTAVMQYGYRIIDDLVNGLSIYMKNKDFKNISELIGLALENIIPADNLDRDFQIIPKIDLENCIGCGRCYISCYDGAHQAIDWIESDRKPKINDKCVGCHLCMNICPVNNCITSGEVKFKPGRKVHMVIL